MLFLFILKLSYIIYCIQYIHTIKLISSQTGVSIVINKIIQYYLFFRTHKLIDMYFYSSYHQIVLYLLKQESTMRLYLIPTLFVYTKKHHNCAFSKKTLSLISNFFALLRITIQNVIRFVWAKR